MTDIVQMNDSNLVLANTDDAVNDDITLERFFNQLVDKINQRPITNALNQTVSQIKTLFQKTSSLIEEERKFSISEESVNGLLGRFVVAKVTMVQDMKATLQNDNFILSANVETHGITMSISGLFEVVNFTFNDEKQVMVFKQLTPTHIEKVFFDSIITHIKVKCGLWFLKNIKKRDFLGFILAKKEVATVKLNQTETNDKNILGDEITIQLGQYFDEGSSFVKTLKKIQITDATIKKGKLRLKSKVNLDGFISEEVT